MDKKSRFVILALMLLVPLFFIVYRSPEKEVLPTGDSGFDSSYDSSDSGGESSSSWDSSSSDGGGLSIDEKAIYKKYFDDGITLDNYLNFFRSSDHIKLFVLDLLFHSFITFCIYFVFDRPKWVKIYYIIVGLILLFLPSSIIVVIEFLGITIFMAIKSKKTRAGNNISYVETDLTPYGIDPDTIHKEIYDIYVRIQKAWMNFTLDDVRDCLSDELYNQYIVQLDTLKVKNQRNIMSDIEYLNCAITSINKKDNKEVIMANLKVKCYDYIIDDNTKKVLRGKKNKINTYDYLLTFERDIGDVITICPNCGGKLDPKGQGITCPYCNSKIIRKSNNLVLHKKEMLHQD